MVGGSGGGGIIEIYIEMMSVLNRTVFSKPTVAEAYKMSF